MVENHTLCCDINAKDAVGVQIGQSGHKMHRLWVRRLGQPVKQPDRLSPPPEITRASTVTRDWPSFLTDRQMETSSLRQAPITGPGRFVPVGLWWVDA